MVDHTCCSSGWRCPLLSGYFESVVAVLPIVICFQSLVLDMAGNVGTQSLAVTIRVLVDEDLDTRKNWLFSEKK